MVFFAEVVTNELASPTDKLSRTPIPANHIACLKYSDRLGLPMTSSDEAAIRFTDRWKEVYQLPPQAAQRV